MFAADPDLDILEQFIGMLNAIMAILGSSRRVRCTGWREKKAAMQRIYTGGPFTEEAIFSPGRFVVGLSILLQTLTAVRFYYVSRGG